MKTFNQKLLHWLLVNRCDIDHDVWISDFASVNLCFPEGILCVENAAEIIVAHHFGLLWLPPVLHQTSAASVFTSSCCLFHSQTHLTDETIPPECLV